MEPRIVAGPPADRDRSRIAAHVARLGPLPARPAGGAGHPGPRGGGLLGRGGAGFPVGRKWRSVAGQPSGRAGRPRQRSRGRAAEREGPDAPPPPAASRHRRRAARGRRRRRRPDRGLHRRPSIATRASAVQRALRERPDLRMPVDLFDAPATYVAGEESAAVHYVNVGGRPADDDPAAAVRARHRRPSDARPERREPGPRRADRPVRGRAGTASAGRAATPGTALVTVSGSDHDGVREIEIGTTVGELAQETGAGRGADDLQAVLLGGYFGGWLATDRGWNVPLDPITLRDAGSRLRRRRRRLPRQRSLRRPGDGPDHGLHGRPERRPVRPLRLRAAGHRGRDGAARRRPARARRPRADRALVPAARRPRRLPPSRTGPSASSGARSASSDRSGRSTSAVGACTRERFEDGNGLGGPDRRVA